MNTSKRSHMQENMSNHSQSHGQMKNSLSQQNVNQMGVQNQDPMTSFGMMNKNNEYGFHQNKTQTMINKNTMNYNLENSRNSFDQSNFKITNYSGEQNK